MNGVDEPTAYASTYSVKPGVNHMYQELERNTTDSPSRFVLQTTGPGSAMSVSSHPARPPLNSFSASGPVRSGPASIQNILSPSEPGAMSMQIPRASGIGQRQTFTCKEAQGSQLVGTSHHRPNNSNSRRGSVPLKARRESQQPLLPGKSMPTIVTSSLPPPPITSPSTPHLLDPPIPYLTPEKPWYKSDHPDSPNTLVSGHCCSVCVHVHAVIPWCATINFWESRVHVVSDQRHVY